jgi:LacI family transcriptional regulator
MPPAKKILRRTSGLTTIDDVARAAGVSAMTVSRVINGGHNVREVTRAAVIEAASKLNFAPNNAARSLASGKAVHIGLLHSNPSAAYLSQFLVGSLSAARRLGLHLVLEPCDSNDPSEQSEIVRALEASHVAGVVVPPPLSESAPILTELAIIGIPVVTVARGRPSAGDLNVTIDDYAAAAEMTRHLIDLGHRTIGFIAGHPNHMASHDRTRGFRDMCADCGIAESRTHVRQGYFTYRSGLAAAEQLLSASPRPTAIFASNDDMAAATVSVAQRRGLRVPADLSVVGFDDTELATTIWPALTTVRQPIAKMAEAALELLRADLRRRESPAAAPAKSRVLGHSLVTRQSSAAPATPLRRVRQRIGDLAPESL